MKNIKPLTALFLILLAITISFGLPKPKYTGLKILSCLNIPYTIADWQGKDVAQDLDVNDERYRFISDIFARTYTNQNKASLMILILDAGNFHNPKVCFPASGYKLKELNDVEINVLNRRLKVHTLYAKKGAEGLLLVYWMCIDKKIVDWAEQKAKELFYSLINKKRVGFMIRLDIPAGQDNIQGAVLFARKFIEGLAGSLPPSQAEYLFGKK